jgi:hypothetical protein
MALVTQDLVATVSPEKAATEILINAHQHDISCVCMNQQGTMLATCSSKVHMYVYTKTLVPTVHACIVSGIHVYDSCTYRTYT